MKKILEIFYKQKSRHMSTMKKNTILARGLEVTAQAPMILSVSRSTDIPAFYADWFLNRLKEGYSTWINPFNQIKSYISYSDVRLVVFWSKNPLPLLEKNGVLEYLELNKINSYVQFTLNDYDADGLEKGVPLLNQRVDTFKRLVDKLGFGRVIWRFDPFILTESIQVQDLLGKVDNVASRLKGYTEKLVFSFADILEYRKVVNNLHRNNIKYKEFSEMDTLELVTGLFELNKKWGLELATCAEKINFEQFSIKHNKCIDDELIAKYFLNDEKLMEFIGHSPQTMPQQSFQMSLLGEPTLSSKEKQTNKKKNIKDKGQRKACGCIISKDIGSYNTCPHLCEYCYANTSKEAAKKNYMRHLQNPFAESIL